MVLFKDFEDSTRTKTPSETLLDHTIQTYHQTAIRYGMMEISKADHSETYVELNILNFNCFRFRQILNEGTLLQTQSKKSYSRSKKIAHILWIGVRWEIESLYESTAGAMTEAVK